MRITETKQRILTVSLDLFSKYGYASVSMEQIASAVGIKAPSLYKHYSGKQAIFDSIFDLMDEKYRSQVEMMQLHLDNGESDLSLFKTASEEVLTNKVIELVSYSIHDPYNREFRKLLTTHQFSSVRIGQLYTERYVDMLINYHRKLFKKLIESGVLVRGDASIMALQYVSPVYTMIGICDREPDREDECLNIIRQHIHQFNEVYRNDRRV